MEDNINDLLMGPSDAPDLLQELASPVTESKTPMSSVRNKAAAIALMSAGDLKQNYDVSVERVKDGTISSTRLWGDIEKGVETDTLQGATSILASPDYSFEEKQRLIRSGKGIQKIDTFTRLAEEGLKADSPGETEEEELVRVNMVDVMDNVMRSRAEQQAIINSHAASLDSSSGKAMMDIIATTLMPFGNTVIQGRLAKARTGSYWEAFKALVAPGTDIRQEEEAFFNIPAKDQPKVLRDIVERVKENAGVILPTDNHYAQWEKLQKIASGEKIATTDEWLENLSPILDAFGIRMELQAGKLFLRAQRTKKALDKAMEGLSKEMVDPLKPVAPTDVQNAPVGPSKALPSSVSKNEDAAIEPGAPGSDAGSGFKNGPKKGEKYRVNSSFAGGGALMLEKRLPAGTNASFYIGKDGKLIDADNISLTDTSSVERLWVPNEGAVKDAALALLDKMGRLPLGSAERNAVKSELEALVTGKKKPSELQFGRSAGTPSSTSTAPSRAPDESLLSRMPAGPNQADAIKRKQIDELEAEKARLLEDQNLAGRGDIRTLEAEQAGLRKPDADPKELAKSIKKANPRMSAKEAREEAQKRINDELADYDAKLSRMGQQIEANKGAAATQQRIADLEKQIATLSKGVPENAGSVKLSLADEISRIEWNNTVAIDNPMSVGNILAATNPGRAKKLFAEAIMNPSDEIVRAGYGTEKADAIASNVMPQAMSEAGVVTSKVPDIDREILERMKPDPLNFTAGEVARAQQNLKDKFRSVSGLSVNDAMGGIKVDGDGSVLSVSSVYGRGQGGFSTAQEALEQTKFALREFGAKDSDIEILARDGMNHRPVKLSEVGDTPGEYYARLSMPYEIKGLDVGVFDPEDVMLNGLDNIPQLMGNRYTGSLTENVLDIATMFTPRFSGSAVRASDKASGLTYYLTKEAKEFTDRFDVLSPVQKKIVHDYLKEANALQLKDNPADLVARGFKPDMLDALKAFRKFWDTHWYLENSDLIRTLNADNWKKLEHPTEEFIAKELPPNMWSDVKDFLDPRTGNIERFGDAMRVSINNANGQLAVLRRPVDINGTVVTHIFVDNNPSSYLRTLRESDGVLKKLDGYYTTVYKAPRFVDKITYEMVGGQERIVRRQAVAVSGDWKSAEHFANTQPKQVGVRYEPRGDERMMQTGGDDWFDIHAARGRISQRHRGKPLIDESGQMNILGDESFVLGPVDSAVRAARSIAGRIAGRAHLENAKARFVQQYRDFLKPDAFGEYHFPSELSMIGQKGIPSTREMADARSTWNKIMYLEHGYLNAADTVVKQMFNLGSVMAGKKGLKTIERAAGAASEVAPMAAAKSTVFNTFVGTNIWRNWIVQMFQTTRMPAYSITGTVKAIPRMLEYINSIATGKETHFTKFIKDSDLLTTVDHQNMVRGSLQNAIDHSNTILNKAMKPVQFARSIGFDAAEQGNLAVHLAVVYERFKGMGKNMDSPRVRSEAYAEVRHLTGNMNFGGDQPYNQTAASAVMQFAQSPHKLLLQYTNRALPFDRRMRLLAWDLFAFGAPTAMVYNTVAESLFPEKTEDKERIRIQKMIVDGWWAHKLNKLLEAELPSDKRIDITSLSPNNMMGQYEMFKALLTGGAEELMSHTPGGALFGESGSVQRAIRMWSRMFKGVVDEDQSPVEIQDAMLATARIFPIANNAYKAYIIKEYNERRNARGVTVEENVPDSHAYFQLFGFGSKNLNEIYALSKQLTEQTKENEDNLYKVYKHSLELMSGVDTKSFDDLEKQIRVTNFLLKPYMDQPWAMSKMNEWMRRDMMGIEFNNYRRLMQLGGMPYNEDIRRIIEQHPLLSDEEKRAYISTMQKLTDSEE